MLPLFSIYLKSMQLSFQFTSCWLGPTYKPFTPHMGGGLPCLRTPDLKGFFVHNQRFSGQNSLKADFIRQLNSKKLLRKLKANLIFLPSLIGRLKSENKIM